MFLKTFPSLEPAKKAMPSSITNCYDPDEKRPRLDVKRVFLYRPVAEWTYSHHPAIVYFPDRFHAIW